MRSSKFSFLVVGTNFISDNFADAVAKVDRACGVSGDLSFRSASGVRISAILSRKEETGRAFAEKNSLDADVVCSLEEAAELYSRGGFDAAYIASPNSLHVEQSVFFLERGIPVLCEKPVTPYAAELDRIASLAETTPFVEAMRPAHDPAMDAIRRAVDKIAPVRMARLEFSQYSSRYDRFLSGERVNTFDPAMGNAALLDLGVYAVACALMLFGEPVEISSESLFLENGFEAAGMSTLVYDSFLCSVSYSKVCESAVPSVILGENGAITIDRLSEPKDVRIRMGKNGDFVPVEPGAPDNNMIYEIANFVKICTEGMDYRAYLELSRAQCAILEKICSNTGIRFSEAE